MPHQPPSPQPNNPQDDAPRQNPADAPPADAEPNPLPFGERWWGKFVLAEVDGADLRYAALVEKYLRL